MPGITLNENEIFSSLSNMLISQQIMGLKLGGGISKFVDRARVDGTLYGDTKQYISTKSIHSYAWGGDSEATNLLQLHRPANPDVQLITLNKFRQAALTTDRYLTKRAFMGEGEFVDYAASLNKELTDCKRIYDATTYNAFLGTVKSSEQGSSGVKTISITLPAGVKLGSEEANRLVAQKLANEIANLVDDIEDLTQDYNDYHNYRSVDKSELAIVWNNEAVNKITKLDLPTVFHDTKVFDGFADVLKSRWFGEVKASAGTSDGTIRSLIETECVKHGDSTKKVAVYAGDLIPYGYDYKAGEAYAEDASIVCKIMHKQSIPYMSAFAVGTDFFNPRSLTETKFLTWGHNTLAYLKEYPMLVVKVSIAESEDLPAVEIGAVADGVVFPTEEVPEGV